MNGTEKGQAEHKQKGRLASRDARERVWGSPVTWPAMYGGLCNEENEANRVNAAQMATLPATRRPPQSGPPSVTAPDARGAAAASGGFETDKKKNDSQKRSFNEHSLAGAAFDQPGSPPRYATPRRAKPRGRERR